jgi:hypothetical protein
MDLQQRHVLEVSAAFLSDSVLTSGQMKQLELMDHEVPCEGSSSSKAFMILPWPTQLAPCCRFR